MVCLPTYYDSFYNNLQIALRLTEIEKIKSQFVNLKIPFDSAFIGYLYFIEIATVNLMLNLEYLICDEELQELIKWGENTLEDDDIQKILINHPEGKYLLELNAIRRNLSTNRYSDTLDIKNLNDKLKELREKLLEIDRKIQDKCLVKRINNSSQLEKKLILEDIVQNYNYIRFSVDFDEESTMGVPLYPGNLTFYLMPNSQKQNYFLANKMIKSKMPLYLAGYRSCLIFLYSEFMPSKRDYIRNIFSNVNDWLELHRSYDMIYNDFHLDKIKKRQLFDVKFRPVNNTINKEKIVNYDDLKNVLRNRRTRFFDDFDLDESILIHYLAGAIEIIKKGAVGENNTRLEIKELVINENGWNRLVYYAIFNPLRGCFSDGSHWLLFEDNEEVCSVPEKIIQKYVEIYPNLIDYHRYFVNDATLIEKYKSEHTYGIKREIHKNEILKSSRGLIGEFIVLFYEIKMYGPKIIKVDCHREIPGTDIDVLIETTEEIMIGQVKPYLSF